ncbi:ComEC family competence protein [Dysgonomonas sp. 216]|uniref:ComEC/Rec2 family competence protein n=1 Tax=Dysgonomonas sp. 216 TaxID=2302934 RepID=UPI0013D29076|nr:ComEC/Rec2 family competence protein [Dysgonomonas sp. 216]NDW17697.1 ComEC family competence protein [Dysgonomonas sp. 216]
MTDFLHKTPFLRFLIPLIVGILIQYYLYVPTSIGFILLFAGLAIMLVSFFINPQKQFGLRWLFGAGLFSCLFAFAVFLTTHSQQKATFSFPDNKESYQGLIINSPQTKENSIMCEVKLDNRKKVICYLQPGIRSRQLQVGENIMFFGKIEPFKNFGDPDEFDYAHYMYNKGFSGSVFLYSSNWETTEGKSFSPSTIALGYRDKILQFYKSLNLDEDSYAMLAALTVGYKDSLSDDLKQSFRKTGTAHVLALSGLHTGIIYGIILSILGLFIHRINWNKYAQVFIIAVLWCYAFVTGLSPSVIRAVIMLSIICVAHIYNRRGLTFNNISFAAFVMLVYEPFYVFDMGFQLSFAAVSAICFFHPYLSSVQIKNRYLRSGWNLFTLSIAAQLGTLPLCLYHFGTFPTYFFISNMLVVPLISLILYTSMIMVVISLFSTILPSVISSVIMLLPTAIFGLLIKILMFVVHFFEGLPFALIENIKVSMFGMLFFVCAIISLLAFLIHRRSKTLIVSQVFVLLIMLNFLAENYLLKDDILKIYSSNNNSIIKWNNGRQIHVLDSINQYRLIPLGNKVLLSTKANYWQVNEDGNRPIIDYLHIFKSDTISLYSLTQTFSIKNVIIDRSLSVRNRNRIKRECENMDIPLHDMAEKGMFRSIF